MSSTPPDLDLNPARRIVFAQQVQSALGAQCPGSVAALRGSLARGTADMYSDIDLAWTVPDAEFDACVAAVGDCLGAVRVVASLRSDPAFHQSPDRRLMFVAFRDMPLFWRLDLEVTTASTEQIGQVGQIGQARQTCRTGASVLPVSGPVSGPTPAPLESWGGRQPQDSVSPRTAETPRWSLAASALANAVAVVKAVLRGQPDVATGLLERGLQRVGASGVASGRWREDVVRLADASAQYEPAQRPLALQIKRLAAELLRE
ncbi:hypothetical protein [Streptomyces sp. NBC_00859]|uniref:nucleotidyltransferase domain-containing protein n=1 Tax=Streptomyces sp. NBC_00859 TaxID=2903682 RepID=UPI003866BCA6|nr:nucleotidyltransferase domain-containing protein [Streptomyces sp. NBC_00859]